MADPIGDAIQALNVLIVPTADGAGSPTETPLFTTIQTLVQAIFNASPSMKTVSSDITGALTEAATVISAIAKAMQTSTGSLSDIGSAMTGLQNILSMAQSLAPAGTSVVLNSASTLFQNIENQLTALAGEAGQSMATAGTELAQLAQLITGLSALFP